MQTTYRQQSHRIRPSSIVLLALCEIVGIAAIVNSYRIALSTTTSEAEFIWFWVGMISLELPLIILIVRKATPPIARTALTILFGMITFAPKLLRNPTAPVYHDEYVHWRAVNNILTTGKLFVPTPVIPIVSRYPGLHAATAAMVNTTGMSIWQSAELLLLLFHVTLVLGIAALAQAVGLSSRTASLTAIFYSFNSSFLYFDTQFGYESMAITLLVWTLVAFAWAIRSRPSQGRGAWCVITVFFSTGTVVTHHLSALDLTLVMALVSLALSIPKLARRGGWVRTAGTAWGLTLWTALVLILWFKFVAPGTMAYLSPFLGTGFSELMQVAQGTGSGRQLFKASLSPEWEQQTAYLATLIVLILAIGGLVMTRRRLKNSRLPPGRARSIILAFSLLGLVYFPSTLFILSQAGAEGARRSWAITWIGLSVLIGPTAIYALDWAGRRSYLASRIFLRIGMTAVMCVALIGGVAAGLDAAYRFPGPFLYGSDARSTTPELVAMGKWFLNRFGPGNNIVTDRYTGLVMASFAAQNPATPSLGFPTYDLYLDKPGQPIGPPFLLDELAGSRYLYLIVDSRMANNIPEVGVYFEDSKENGFILPDGKSVFQGRLGKFNTTSWMEKVYQSNNYSVYRMNLPATQNSYQTNKVNFSGKLLVKS